MWDALIYPYLLFFVGVNLNLLSSYGRTSLYLLKDELSGRRAVAKSASCFFFGILSNSKNSWLSASLFSKIWHWKKENRTYYNSDNAQIKNKIQELCVVIHVGRAWPREGQYNRIDSVFAMVCNRSRPLSHSENCRFFYQKSKTQMFVFSYLTLYCSKH